MQCPGSFWCLSLSDVTKVVNDVSSAAAAIAVVAATILGANALGFWQHKRNLVNGGLKVGLLEGKRRSYSRSLADGNTVLVSGRVPSKNYSKLTDFHLIYRQLQSSRSAVSFNSLLSFITEALSCVRDKND